MESKSSRGSSLDFWLKKLFELELQKRRQQQQQQQEKEEQVFEEVKVVEEEQRNAPPPPPPRPALWSVAAPDWWIDRMPPSSPSPQQQAKMEGDQRTAARKETLVVVEKDGRSDVMDKETGGAEEMSIQQQEMVVDVEKDNGSDVEQQMQAKAPSPWPPPKLQGLPAGLRALIARSDPSGPWWSGVRYDGGHGKEDIRKKRGI